MDEDRLKEKLNDYFKNNIGLIEHEKLIEYFSIDKGIDRPDIIFINDIINIVKSISLSPSPSDLLNDVEKENAKKYMAKVKKKYGEVGVITYSFTCTGIGHGISIKSSLKKKEKDITDYNCW